MNKDEVAGAIILIAVILLIPFLAVMEGWALTETWRLLLIPAMFDYAEVTVKPLSIGVAIAAAFTIRQFVSTGRDTSDNKKQSTWVVVLVTLSKPFITVFFAWLLSLFI